jgi:hypothetical protein
MAVFIKDRLATAMAGPANGRENWAENFLDAGHKRLPAERNEGTKLGATNV